MVLITLVYLTPSQPIVKDHRTSQPITEYLVEGESALLPDGPMGDVLLRLEPQVLQHVSPLILHNYLFL